MVSVREVVARKRAVVFDLFHTLTAIESSWGSGLPFTHEMLGVSREAWHEQLYRHSRERLAGAQKDPFRIVSDMARAIGPSLSDKAIKAAVANRIRRFEAALLDIPEETQAALRALKAGGKKLGLITNADAMEVAAWDRSPIAGMFDAAVHSCCVGAVKPEREIYAICLDRLGISPEEAIYVGDGGSSELRGAREAGMATVMIVGVIRELWPDEIEPRKAHADFVIEQLSELVDEEG